MKRQILSAVLLLALTVSPALGAETTREQSDRVVPAGRLRVLEVDNGRGRVDIRPSRDGQLHITALKISRGNTNDRAHEMSRHTSVETEAVGETYRIVVRYPTRISTSITFWDLFKGETVMPRIEVRLLIEAPPALALRLKAVSGDLETAGMTGSQELRTTSGDVRISGAGAAVDVGTVSGDVDLADVGPLRLGTTSGDLAVNGVRGPAELRSVSGDIRVAGAADSLRIETTSGSVIVDDAPRGLIARGTSGDFVVRGAAGRVRISTQSGELRARVRGPLAAAELSTLSGDLYLDLADGMDARIELHSTSGDIQTSIPIRMSTVTNHEASGILGRGGALIAARSTSGDISVTSGGH